MTINFIMKAVHYCLNKRIVTECQLSSAIYLYYLQGLLQSPMYLYYLQGLLQSPNFPVLLTGPAAKSLFPVLLKEPAAKSKLPLLLTQPAAKSQLLVLLTVQWPLLRRLVGTRSTQQSSSRPAGRRPPSISMLCRNILLEYKKTGIFPIKW